VPTSQYRGQIEPLPLQLTNPPQSRKLTFKKPNSPESSLSSNNKPFEGDETPANNDDEKRLNNDVYYSKEENDGSYENRDMSVNFSVSSRKSSETSKRAALRSVSMYISIFIYMNMYVYA
jgi:hypothetical protein